MKRDARRRFVLSPLEDRVVPTADFLPDRILVRTFSGDASSPLAASVQPLGFGIFSVHLNPSVTVPEAITYYQNAGAMFAEPDYVVGYMRTPSDPSFGALWGLNNVGQAGGTLDADINAPEAWEFTRGTGETVVAVLDTGIDYSHPDLAANMWVNAGETPADGIDNDGNGFVDDIHGYDFANGDADPFDDNGHGTHAAGTIGAVGDNATGTAGVNWHARVMALKFLGADGKGSIGNAISALSYAVRMGARVSNSSWGGGGYSAAMCMAIEAARDAGHLFVAAAGNAGSDNDETPSYPSSYVQDNVLAVAATDRSDHLGSFTNIGKTSVDLAAPGVGIFSTYKNGQYATLSGSSMAAPYVAGAAALLWDANPGWTYAEVATAILSTVDVLPQLKDKVATSGRLNLARSMTYRPEFAGPQVVASAFSGTDPGTLDTLRLSFDTPIWGPSFTPADVAFSGPGGPITVQSVTPVGGSVGTEFVVKFARQSRTGTYTAVVGPAVQDRAGNSMDQNGNGLNGDPTDTYVTSTSLDRDGARVVDHVFDESWAGVAGLSLTFNKPVDPDSFTVDDVTVSGPTGTIAVTGVEAISATEFYIEFARQAVGGTYRVVVGPDVRTDLGDPMDQDEDGVNGEAADVYVATTSYTDRAGPRVLDAIYGGTATRLTSIRVTFSERIKVATLTAADVVLRGPSGARIAVSGVRAVIGSGNTQFDISFAAQTAGGTYTVQVGPAVQDLSGNGMDQDEDGTPGETTDVFTGSTVLETPVVRRPVSDDRNRPLADQGRTVSTLVVSEHMRITDLNVRVNIAHNHTSDLALTLVSPTGTWIVLSYRRGGSGDGFVGTVFDDEAAQHVADGLAPFTGAYRPDQPLAAFDGTDARGVWKLVIDDVSAGAAGRLMNWSLVLSGTPFTGPKDPLPGPSIVLPPSPESYDADKKVKRDRTRWADVNQFFQ